jgi:hypothetical protein
MRLRVGECLVSVLERRAAWTTDYASVSLRFPIRWMGSRLLADAGLRDAYRTAFPDEVRHPGNTWTPSYPENTPGRRPYVTRYLIGST